MVTRNTLLQFIERNKHLLDRKNTVLQIAIAVTALVFVGGSLALLPSDDTGDSLEAASPDVVIDATSRLEATADTAAQPTLQPAALPAGSGDDGAPADETTTTASPTTDSSAPSSTEGEQSGGDGHENHDHGGNGGGDNGNNNGGGNNGGGNNNNGGGHNHNHDHGGSENPGYDVHNFVDHANQVLGNQMLEPGQERDGGYQQLGPYEIRAWSPITGLRPVIQQAITDVTQKDPNLSGEALERKIAKRLTELNDWKNLDNYTRETMMVLAGFDIQEMDKKERENLVNHLLHSPLPFGDIPEVLSPEVTIDMGFTHTLDKKWTEAAHLGDGVFQIWMVSNNNNGSHTGHVLGSFKVQLTPTTSIQEARQVGNEMVKNKNNNNKLYLAEAARRVLYGETPWLDYNDMTPDERRAVYAGRSIENRNPTLPPTGADPEDPAPTDPADPDPTDPEDPAPTDPADPDPTDPEDPAPTDPADPDPTDPEDPAPTDPADPDPTDPAPTDPEQPQDPAPDPDPGTGDGPDGIVDPGA